MRKREPASSFDMCSHRFGDSFDGLEPCHTTMINSCMSCSKLPVWKGWGIAKPEEGKAHRELDQRPYENLVKFYRLLDIEKYARLKTLAKAQWRSLSIRRMSEKFTYGLMKGALTFMNIGYFWKKELRRLDVRLYSTSQLKTRTSSYQFESYVFLNLDSIFS